jgi:hypothetical protein
MGLAMIDDEDTDCIAWLQPEIHLRDLPRIKLDRFAIASAAQDIARELPSVVRDVMASRLTDQRLLPHLRLAMAERERKAS